MNEISLLYRQVQSCFRINLGRAVAALFVMLMCISAVSSALLFPAVLGGGAAYMAVPAFVACGCFAGILKYGYNSILIRMYRHERAILGHLFSGFSLWGRICGIICMVYLSVIGFAVLLSIPFSFIVMRWPSFAVSQSADGPPSLNISLAFGVSAALCCISYIVVFTRFGLAYLCLYDNPASSVSESLRKSVSLLKGFRLKFLLFCLRCGGIWLLLTCLCGGILFGVSLFVLGGSVSLPPQAVAGLYALNSAAYVCGYVSVIKLSLASAAFYNWRCSAGAVSEKKMLPEEG